MIEQSQHLPQNPNLELPTFSPELLWRVIQHNVARVAWRRAVAATPQSGASEKTLLESKAAYPAYNKNKFTGSPAFKELKNLIIVILTNQTDKKGNS